MLDESLGEWYKNHSPRLKIVSFYTILYGFIQMIVYKSIAH